MAICPWRPRIVFSLTRLSTTCDGSILMLASPTFPCFLKLCMTVWCLTGMLLASTAVILP